MTAEERAKLIESKEARTQEALYDQFDTVSGVLIFSLTPKDAREKQGGEGGRVDWRIIGVVAVSVKSELGMNRVPCFEVVQADCGDNPRRKFIPISEVGLLDWLQTKTSPQCFLDSSSRNLKEE